MGLPEIRIVVQGSPGKIGVGVLVAAAKSLSDLLQRGGEGWVVSGLAVGSIDIVARPQERTDAEVDAEFNQMVQDIDAIRRGEDPPSGDERVLHGILQVNDRVLSQPGVTGTFLELGGRRFQVDARLTGNARRLFERSERRWRTFGSVTGVIDRFKSRGSSRELGLVDEASGHPVTVRFAQTDEDRVRSLIGCRVTVWGVLRRDASGEKKDLWMEGLEERTTPSRQPATLEQVQGLFGRDWTGGLDSVTWVRQQRRA